MNSPTLLVLLLRLAGTVELLAFTAVVMPRAEMARFHYSLGLGEFPSLGITDFMIRQASYTYAVHGIVLWLLSTNLNRYRPLIALTGLSYTVAGPLFAWIDWTSGMPPWWTVFDGLACLLFGMAILILLSRIRAQATTSEPEK